MQLQQHCLSTTTSVMHPGQIFVITCPTLLHNSIKNTLTYGGNMLQQLRGNKQANPWKGRRMGIVVCGASTSPTQGSEPTLTPLSQPLGPKGQILCICGHTLPLHRGSLSALDKPREGTF